MQINRICGLLYTVSLPSEMVALGYSVSDGNVQLLELARLSKVLTICGRLIEISVPCTGGDF